MSDEESLVVTVPGYNKEEGLNFLESVAAGNVGAGVKMSSFGHSIPAIRSEYKVLIERFENQLEIRKSQNLPAREIARWAVNERTRIAKLMRAKQGGGTQILLELRDNVEYGLGGRTYENLEKRQLNRGVNSEKIPDALLKSATKPNSGISKAAIEGGKFLKHGGKVVVVLSISVTAYTLLTAPEDQLEKIIYEELGGVAGGALGGGAAVGLCLVFGIATSGWGLLACGVVGGGIGGYAGSSAGNQIYLLKQEYVRNSDVAKQGFEVYDPSKFIGSLK